MKKSKRKDLKFVLKAFKNLFHDGETSDTELAISKLELMLEKKKDKCPLLPGQEIYGSNSLEKWVGKFYDQYGYSPIELFREDKGWINASYGGHGRFSDLKYRLTKEAISLLYPDFDCPLFPEEEVDGSDKLSSWAQNHRVRGLSTLVSYNGTEWDDSATGHFRYVKYRLSKDAIKKFYPFLNSEVPQ
jgi:hypothetical protein